MQHDSDDDSVALLGSRSEPIRSRRNENMEDQENALRTSKSDAFTIFGPRKLSLMNDSIKDTDVYATRNPSDSWLRRQLDDAKQTSQPKQIPAKVENETEADSKENLSIDDIKKKYGKTVKSPKTQRRGQCQ